MLLLQHYIVHMIKFKPQPKDSFNVGINTQHRINLIQFLSKAINFDNKKTQILKPNMSDRSTSYKLQELRKYKEKKKDQKREILLKLTNFVNTERYNK